MKAAKVVLKRPKLEEGIVLRDLKEFVAKGIKCGTIYIDPPWRYDNQSTRGATGDVRTLKRGEIYKTLSLKEIAELPIDALAATDAHLHLWTTNAFLFSCPDLFSKWGFQFKSSFVWIKEGNIGTGNYWRNSHEIMLTAVRGNAKHFAVHDLSSWFKHPRLAHSEKPFEVRRMIERASPPPRIELFARHVAPGWYAWGNEALISGLLV